MAKINFFAEEINFKISHPRKTASWIKKVIDKEKHSLEELNYIFCTDAYLLNLNRQYLSHDTLTDIITFNNSEKPGCLSGDVFISIDRVRENATTFKVSFDLELCRVIIHGALHLMGYSDKTSTQKLVMRKKEEACLSLLK
jgi:probable rRNA maturation factor